MHKCCIAAFIKFEYSVQFIIVISINLTFLLADAPFIRTPRLSEDSCNDTTTERLVDIPTVYILKFHNSLIQEVTLSPPDSEEFALSFCSYWKFIGFEEDYDVELFSLGPDFVATSKL